ncbi:MAG: macro domain-containing protein [Nitrospinae bacterium]|nr:macro domain-containing protein [Nitrospinota bacterium]
MKRVGPVELIVGDIVSCPVDAIVNPSNEQLILGAGVSGAIAAAAGPTVQQEMTAIGDCAVGEAVVTGAGALPYRAIIHTVGPRKGEGQEDLKLQRATKACLDRAEELGLSSIAFPAVSTGVFGFPLEQCAMIMLTVVLDHFSPGAGRSLQKVVFCLHDREAYETFSRTLDWVGIHHL